MRFLKASFDASNSSWDGSKSEGGVLCGLSYEGMGGFVEMDFAQR